MVVAESAKVSRARPHPEDEDGHAEREDTEDKAVVSQPFGLASGVVEHDELVGSVLSR